MLIEWVGVSVEIQSVYSTAPAERAMEIREHIKKSDKTNKKSKRLQLQQEIGEIRINYFTRNKNESWSNWNFQKWLIVDIF